MKKVLILSVFPAPYRVELFKLLKNEFEIDTFFERLNDENRSPEWFAKNNDFKFEVIDNYASKKNYKDKIKKIGEYDLVAIYDYSTKEAMKLMFRCILNKKKYVINCDGAFINKSFFKTIIKNFFVSRAAACLANGEHAKQYFLNFGAKESNIYLHEFSTLRNNDILECDIDKKQLRQKLGIEDKKTVITVGQFVHRKGFDILLEAWKNIPSSYQLLIIGGGEKEQEYKQFINENNMSNVELIGFKSKTEIFDYYKASDLFVLPTREDVWGLVINEAMACGLPVITTNRCVAGLELIENDVNGYIVPVDNIDELENRIKDIMSNEKLIIDMGKNNIEKIKDYTIENMAESHIEVFQKLMNRS